jgi:hypothetical protein
LTGYWEVKYQNPVYLKGGIKSSVK